jgi:hypothetical protein
LADREEYTFHADPQLIAERRDMDLMPVGE